MYKNVLTITKETSWEFTAHNAADDKKKRHIGDDKKDISYVSLWNLREYSMEKEESLPWISTSSLHQ